MSRIHPTGLASTSCPSSAGKWLLAKRIFPAFALVGVLSASAMTVRAQEAHKWIGTWTASPQALWDGDFPLSTNVPFNLWNQTIRMVTQVSLGGKQARVALSNEYGSRPLVIGGAHVALTDSEAKIVHGSDRPLTFGGEARVIIPPGAKVVSDPTDLDVPPLGKLSVSLFLPEATPLSTFHWDGRQTAYIATGNLIGADDIKAESTISARVFVSGILVDAPKDARAVVTMGDSITDGNGSTPDANSRWPDFLAKRLADKNVAVLNAGISGARLLQDHMGANALARFERDVLSQPHVKAVILLMGINDIAWPGSSFAPDAPPVTSAAVIAGYRHLIARARTHGVRIIGATLTPFEGALEDTPLEGYFTAEKERTRQSINHWIRTSGEFDAVVDFDAATRDPQNPTRVRSTLDSGDHLHPGNDGYEAMADAVDLQALLGTP
jgi:lysophospholipase L1-like esterase